jgi:hypothetical protein
VTVDLLAPHDVRLSWVAWGGPQLVLGRGHPGECTLLSPGKLAVSICMGFVQNSLTAQRPHPLTLKVSVDVAAPEHDPAAAYMGHWAGAEIPHLVDVPQGHTHLVRALLRGDQLVSLCSAHLCALPSGPSRAIESWRSCNPYISLAPHWGWGGHLGVNSCERSGSNLDVPDLTNRIFECCPGGRQLVSSKWGHQFSPSDGCISSRC